MVDTRGATHANPSIRYKFVVAGEIRVEKATGVLLPKPTSAAVPATPPDEVSAKGVTPLENGMMADEPVVPVGPVGPVGPLGPAAVGPVGPVGPAAPVGPVGPGTGTYEHAG